LHQTALSNVSGQVIYRTGEVLQGGMSAQARERKRLKNLDRPMSRAPSESGAAFRLTLAVLRALAGRAQFPGMWANRRTAGGKVMAYIVARFYTGTAAADIDQMMTLCRNELIPQLEQLPGFQRYTIVQAKDGRVGSVAIFDNKEAAQESNTLAKRWVDNKPEFAKYPRDALTFQGEIGSSVTGPATVKPDQRAYGAIRLYNTSASFEDVQAAIQREGLPQLQAIPGLVRYTTVKLDDGRIASFTTFESEEAARASTEKARELRGKGESLLKKVLPNDPEVIEVTVLYSQRK
jgi:hypothetical protein